MKRSAAGRYADYGLDIYGPSLITGDEWIQAHPKLLMISSFTGAAFSTDL